MATSENICKFNQSGFCKFQSHCRKQHIMDICKNIECGMVTCIHRHPRVCRYFINFGRCKFNESCAFLHKSDDKVSELRREQEKEVEKLRQEVKELQMQVNDLRNIVNQLMNSPNQTSSDLQVTRSSLLKSTLASNHSNLSINCRSNPPTNLDQVIPQLDGSIESCP